LSRHGHEPSQHSDRPFCLIQCEICQAAILRAALRHCFRPQLTLDWGVIDLKDDEGGSPVPASVLAALQSSGFPFQTAVAHVINPSIGWELHSSEYPWHTPNGDSHFLDIVATNRVVFLAIECKKTRKEFYTFLRPLSLSHTGLVETFRCLRAKQIPDSTRRVELFCEEWAVSPKSTASEFCVVSTSTSGKDQRLLERDAGMLVRATDAFAQDFRQRFRADLDPAPSTACLFLPVIVTNAPIYTTRYRPTDVSLDTGEFSVPPREIDNVPWVRFRKAFTSDDGADLGERSVFVIHAASFTEFLKQVAPAPVQPDEKASVHFSGRSSAR